MGACSFALTEPQSVPLETVQQYNGPICGLGLVVMKQELCFRRDFRAQRASGGISAHKELGVYHGELVGKSDVMRAFLAQSEVSGDYDFSRITAVVDMIVSDCTVLRESVWIVDPKAS